MSEAAAQQQQQQQDLPPAFHTTLEQDISGHASMAKFRTASDMGRAYIALETQSTKTSQELQQLKAAQEPKAAHQIVPEKFSNEAYGLHKEAQVERWGGRAQRAFEAGITPEQFFKWSQIVAKAEGGRDRAAQMDANVRQQDAINTLRQHWGQNFDANLKAAEFAAKRLQIEEPLRAAGLNADPRVMNALAEVGGMLADDQTLGIRGGRQSFGGTPSPQALDAQANKLTMDAWAPGVDQPTRERMLNEAADIRRQSARARGLT